MQHLSRWFAAPQAFRYLVLILLIAAAAGLSWLDYLHNNMPYYSGEWPFGTYLLATPIWILFAVLERRRLAWRLMLIWSPALLPLADFVYAAFDGDSADQGIAVFFTLFVLGGVATACLIGSVAAVVYRPDEAPQPSP